MSTASHPIGISNRFGPRALAGLAALLLAACGGGSAPGALPAGDIVAPTAQASLPQNSASGVDSRTAISATFSEAMDTSTLNAATFTVSAGGAAVPGSVSANGSTANFTPAAPLSGGTLFTATVSTGAKDLAGNPLATAHTWSFTTLAPPAARAWSTPVLLETADGEARTPAIAATSDDAPTAGAQATAVWIQHDGAHDSVYANRYSGGAWQGAQRIEDQNIDATSPRVAMGAFGRTVMTWGHGYNGVYTVWGNVYDPIPPLAAQPLPFASGYARQLSVGGNASTPQVAFDRGGYNAFSVWTQYVPDRQPAAYRPAQQPYLFVPCDVIPTCAWVDGDNGWRATTLLDIAGGEGSMPQIAALGGSADMVAAWRKYSDGIWASTHTSLAGWTTPVQLAVGAAPGDTLSVAGATDGSAIAVWIDSSGSRPMLVASRFNGAAWSSPVVMDNPAAGDSSEAQVQIDAAGKALFVWLQAERVYARRCAAGALSGCADAALVGNPSDGAEFVRLAGAPSGDAVVAWRQAGGATPRIFANHYDAATSSWDPAPTLVGDASRFNEGPEVAIDRRGKATLVWAKDEAGKTNVYASRLD